MSHLDTLVTSTLVVVAQVALKSSLVIAFAAGINRILRRRSAALRHILWTMALGSVALIAVAGPSLPAWQIVPVPQRLATMLAPEPVAQASVSKPIAPEVNAAPVKVHKPARVKKSTAAAVTVVAEPSAVVTTSPSSTGVEHHGPTWQVWLLAVWLVGALAMLMRYVWSSWRVHRLVSASRRLLTQEWLTLEHHVSSALRIGRPVTLMTSDLVDVPITCGVLYPHVVLPAAADEWTSARRHAVIAHELAHVKRFDAATQWIAFGAAIACWFNPLVWYAVRQMRFERERACDDFVLASGARASEYATDLLAIVSSFRGTEQYSVALAMARRSQFEGRLLALLDPKLNHKFLSRGVLAIAGLLSLAIVLPVAAAHLAPTTGVVAPAALTKGVTAPATLKSGVVAPELQGVVAPQSLAANEATSQSADNSSSTRVQPETSAPTLATHSASALAQVAAPAPEPQPARASRQVAAPAPTAAGAPAAPASPAPPAPSFNSGVFSVCRDVSNRNISRSDDDGNKSWDVTIRGANCDVEMRARGDFRFKPDLSGVESVSNGGYVKISSEINGESNELEARPGPNGVQYTYSRNGTRMPMDAAAQEWLRSFLSELDRSSAFAVDTRLPQLLAQGGPARVLQETAQMGDYARSVYIAALMKRAQLSPTDAREVVRQAANTNSDYYSAQMLMAISDRYSLDDPTIGPSFVDAIDHLQSDYYHAEVLNRFLDKSSSISKQRADVLLRSASRIKSDYYVTEVLQHMAKKHLIAADAWPAYLDATKKVNSDYYRTELLKLLMQSYSGDPMIVERSILAAENIGSDYYKLEVLRSAKDRFKMEGGVRDAYLRVAKTIQSDTYRNQALAGLMTSGTL